MIKPQGGFSIPKRRAVKSKPYLAWIHELPCLITRQYGVQAAHLSFTNRAFGHYGRGRQTKAGDRWVLPLSPRMHDEQHSGSEEAFWSRYGINPHLACVILWGVFSEVGNDGLEEAVAIINAGDFRL
jgi:hypothetical protein